MDLDDSFAERLIQKNKAREKFLNQQKETCLVGKKRVALEEQQFNSDDPNEESPKRQCKEISQSAYSSYDKENAGMQKDSPDAAFVPFHSTSKIRGLAALKKNNFSGDDEDTIPTAEQKVNKCDKYVYSTNSSDLCSTQKSRFANLAANIRQWEDDTRQPTLSSNSVTSNTKFQMPLTNNPSSASKSTFSMKLYYTDNKPSNINSSGKHVDQVSSNYKHTVSTHGNWESVTACKRGNIEVGSVGGKQKKMQDWDKAVMAALETPTSVKSPVKSLVGTSDKRVIQSFSQNANQEESSDDESIDETDFDENYSDIKSDSGSNKMEWDYSTVKQVQKEDKLEEPVKSKKVEKPKSPVLQVSTKLNVDPAELPLSARKALFEKALLGGTPKVNENVVDQKLSVAQRAAMFENASRAHSGTKNSTFKDPNRIVLPNFPKSEKSNNVQLIKSPVKTVTKPDSEKIPASPAKKIPTATPSPSKNVGSHTRLIQQKLIESTGSNSQEKEVAKAVEERKQEISNLVNHWEKLSSSSSTENNSEKRSNLASEERISYESYADEEEEFDEESECDDDEDKDHRDNINNEIDTNAIEEDQDIENDDQAFEDENDTEESDNAENVFLQPESERVSVNSTGKNYNNGQNAGSIPSSCKSFKSGSSSLSGVSSYTDNSNYHASNSHSSSSGSSAGSFDASPRIQNANVETSENSKNSKNPEIPLQYTISFYRKQKQETKLTPVRTIVRREKVSSPESPPDTDYTEIIQERLKGLQEEILRQQTVISQTSQALNLCSATAEFSGSTEQVEGERLLLIATQKRQACLNEMTRLKTCGAQRVNVTEGTGTLTITDLQLPLKREFIASQLEGKGNDTVHYFLCLIRHGAQVIVTQMMSSDDKSSGGALCFTNHIQLRDLPADFSVVFEVYALQTKKEVLPHEKKYHIKRDHSKIRLTPKGRKCDGKLPAISSPGGPNAVRSPSFGVVGYTRFTLQNCNKKTFTLDKVPFTSPLEGVLRVTLQLHAEHKVLEKGFLTMFEDVSGFGAWHRRWCVLDANHIAYWKYPDDEHKKEPIGIIDLKQCVTGVVKPVSRDVCARPHTFQLVTVRPQQKGDKNTLITRSVNTLTTTKHLLSADTKDERILWCNKLNEALTNVRKWDPEALRSIGSMQD